MSIPKFKLACKIGARFMGYSKYNDIREIVAMVPDLTIRSAYKVRIYYVELMPSRQRLKNCSLSAFAWWASHEILS